MQRVKQVIPVFPRRIEDSWRDANVMFLRLRGDLRTHREREESDVALRAPGFNVAEECPTVRFGSGVAIPFDPFPYRALDAQLRIQASADEDQNDRC
jgi:hypothetical protein